MRALSFILVFTVVLSSRLAAQVGGVNIAGNNFAGSFRISPDNYTDPVLGTPYLNPDWMIGKLVLADQTEIEAPVLERLEILDAADGSDVVELRAAAVVGLPSGPQQGDRDQSFAVYRVPHHGAIARLEDVQREHRSGEEHDAGQREDGDVARRGCVGGVTQTDTSGFPPYCTPAWSRLSRVSWR